MARTRHPGKHAAEQKFPHRVDVPVPPGGLGNCLNEMEAWCRLSIRAGEWDHHNHSEKEAGQVPHHFSRFYFATAEDADLFRWRWVKP